MKGKLVVFAILVAVLALAACAPAGDPANNTIGTNTGNTTTNGTGGDTTGGTTTGGDTAVNACANATSEDLVSAGNQIYTDMCAGCHGAAGEGQASFPALVGNANITAQDATQMVTNFFNLEAHPFLADMTPDEIAQVLSYARVTFGNNASVVCSDVVESLQPAQ